jgi:hypothetical protein
LPLAGYKYWSFQKVSMIVVEIGYGYIGAGQQQDQLGPYMVDHLSFIRQLVAIHLAEMDPLLSSLSYEVITLREQKILRSCALWW